MIAQADYPYRAKAEDILRLKTRNEAGEMVPLGSVVQVSQSYGPDRGVPLQRLSHRRRERRARARLFERPGAGGDGAHPRRDAAERREVRVDRPHVPGIHRGQQLRVRVPLCVLLVVLVLAALYESWTLPLAIVAIVPMALLSAIVGLWLTGGDNNIFTQIALFVLVGLASKNAILIVEFAKDREKAGVDPVAAALEAARLRLRPILMTSIAFIMGVVPLVFSSGAGAEMRHAIGIAVFAGMIGATLFRSVPDTTLLRVARRRLAAASRRPWPLRMRKVRLMRNQVLAVFSALLLAACAVGRLSPSEVATSDQFVGVEGAKFSSARSSASLESVQRPAAQRDHRALLAANHDIRIATARLREARALRGETSWISRRRCKRQPATRRRGRAIASSRRCRTWIATRTSTIPASMPFWELDFFGRAVTPCRGEFGRSAVRRSHVYATQVSVTAEVARNYFELRGAQQQLAVAQRNAENQVRRYASRLLD